VRTRSPDGDGGGASPIEAAVRRALERLNGTDLADLTVVVDDGRVDIDGTVATEGDLDRVVRAIGEVPGVVAVIETIRVRL
jgi:osmotically-inducible protein OsmY